MYVFYQISVFDPSPLRIRSISTIRYNPHLNPHPTIIRSDPNPSKNMVKDIEIAISDPIAGEAIQTYSRWSAQGEEYL